MKINEFGIVGSIKNLSDFIGEVNFADYINFICRLDKQSLFWQYKADFLVNLV